MTELEIARINEHLATISKGIDLMAQSINTMSVALARTAKAMEKLLEIEDAKVDHPRFMTSIPGPGSNAVNW